MPDETKCPTCNRPRFSDRHLAEVTRERDELRQRAERCQATTTDPAWPQRPSCAWCVLPAGHQGMHRAELPQAHDQPATLEWPGEPIVRDRRIAELESEVQADERAINAARDERDEARAAAAAREAKLVALIEAWEAEENEHRLAGEFGIAEGLKIAIDGLREAVHGEVTE